jgi:hypothetical protein
MCIRQTSYEKVKDMPKESFEMEPEMYEEVNILKKKMGCKTKSELYRTLLSAGILSKKKEYGIA